MIEKSTNKYNSELFLGIQEMGFLQSTRSNFSVTCMVEVGAIFFFFIIIKRITGS